MLLPKQRRFLGCKVDVSRVTETMPQVITFYAHQVLRKKSYIDGDEEVCRSADVYVKAMEEIEMRKRLNLWEVPEGLPSMQTFSRHMLYHQGTYVGEEELLQKSRNVSASRWSRRRRPRLNSYSVVSLLAVYCGAAGISKKSRHYHRKMMARKCLLAV